MAYERPESPEVFKGHKINVATSSESNFPVETLIW